MQVGSVIETEIQDLTTQGNGLGRVDGRVVFVPDALPGELVRARVSKLKKKHAECALEEILRPSPLRVKAPCPLFGTCGGCTLQDLSYAGQLEYKHAHVTDCLQRIGRAETDAAFTVPSPKDYRYRNKATFALEKTESGYVKVGFYELNSHRVVDVSDCLLQDATVARIMSQVRVWITRSGVTVYDPNTGRGLLRNIVVRRNSSGDFMLILVGTDDRLPAEKLLLQLLQLAFPQVKSIVLKVLSDPARPEAGSRNVLLKGPGWMYTVVCGMTFRIGPDSFLQVNSAQTETLYRQLIRALPIRREDAVLDLFCGIGTISLLAAKRAKTVTGIEYVSEAVENASFNADLNEILNARFLAGDARDVARDVLDEERPEIVIANPPRGGLGSGLADMIAESNPRAVGYVSCDPSTLARDVARFRSHGFELQTVQPVDMFPQTTHIETVVVLTKGNSESRLTAPIPEGI